jgi:hypothetical protein
VKVPQSQERLWLLLLPLLLALLLVLRVLVPPTWQDKFQK